MDQLTVYFHGQPGSPAELELFGGCAPAGWWVPDRQRAFGGAPGADHPQRIAAALRARAAGRPVRLVGFSLGAWLALEVAGALPDLAITLELVSPAGPLGDGAVLREMAGGPVFALARRSPLLFGTLTWVQAGLARLAPRMLAAGLFRGAGGADRGLWARPAFRATMAANLRAGVGFGTDAYRSEVMAYVRGDAARLAAMRHPVQIWHGSADTWAPLALVAALVAALPPGAGLTTINGAGHYATLAAWLDSAAA